MKKKIVTIKTLGLLLFLLCSVCLYYSCKTNNCSDYEITQQEIAFLSAYNQGDIAVFKNDSTGIYDTMHVTDKSYGTMYYYEPCNQSVNVALSVDYDFSHINGGTIQIIHVESPEIVFFGGGYVFELDGSSQSMFINGINYNDVFVTSIDSTTISSINHNKVPWKINYSKSKGFVRFYMVNGQTWSKL